MNYKHHTVRSMCSGITVFLAPSLNSSLCVALGKLSICSVTDFLHQKAYSSIYAEEIVNLRFLEVSRRASMTG